MKEKRDKELNGFLTFDQGLKIGLLIAVAYGITYAIFSFVHENYVSPGIIETRILHDRKTLLAQGSRDLVGLIPTLKELYGSPMYSMHGFLSFVAIGIVASFGISVILKKISTDGVSRWKPIMVLSIGLLAITLNLMCATLLPFRALVSIEEFLGSLFLGLIGLVVALVVWTSDRKSMDSSGRRITKWGSLCTTVSLVGTVVLFGPVLFDPAHYVSDKDFTINTFNWISHEAWTYRNLNGSYEGYKLPQRLLDPDGIGMVFVFETQVFRDSIILKGKMLHSEYAIEAKIDTHGNLRKWKYWGDWQ